MQNTKVLKWLNEAQVSLKMKQSIKEMDEATLNDAFDNNLEFGTAGMRALLGPGNNRMNIYTVSKATYGLAKYIDKKFKGDKSVCIAYDSRYQSREFSEIAAQVLASFDIKTIIFDSVKPTPMLSFLVREKKAQAGIVITASHNPKEYNGYKVYNPSGSQLNLDETNELVNFIDEIDDIFAIPLKEEYSEFVTYIDENFDEIYIESIKDIQLNSSVNKNLKIVFTPVHGTSGKIMPKVLKSFGYNNIICVEEQMLPDPEFSNTISLNPEEKECYELAIEYAIKNDADLIIANDPDADRLGIMIKNNNEFIALTGNETGTLMIDYILANTKLEGNEIIYKTIVTGEMGALIAKKYDVEVQELLTGFKFIGEQLFLNDISKIKKKFLFGYEESYGYLIKSIARDKDALQASVLIAEMVSFYKEKGMTLQERLNELYVEYGYYEEKTYSITLSGTSGLVKLKSAIEKIRLEELKEIANIKITNTKDYKKGIENLPISDVIKYSLENTGWVVLRPSGTEPKLKIYVSTKAENQEKSQKLNREIYNEIANLINNLI